MPPPIVQRILQTAAEENRKILLEPESKEICRAYNMPTPDFVVVTSVAEALTAAEKVRFPVVLKIVSQDIVHKTEAGAVLVGLSSTEEVEKGYKEITANALAYNKNARIRGVIVQHMAPKGVEVIVGGLHDIQFGPTVLFGLGGIFVEVLKDVSFRVAPMSELDSRDMIHEIHSHAVLKGIRGQPPADEEAIVRILQGVSQIMLDNSAVAQLDLNPVMVYGDGASIVDARVILAN